MRRLNFTLPAAALLGIAITVRAAGAAPVATPQLTDCLSKAEQQPDQALEQAQAWEKAEGGDLARFCQALALYHLGRFGEAAGRLEALVAPMAAGDPRVAAGILAKAGWAWLRDGRPDLAEKAYSEALGHRPTDPDLLIDRAVARIEAGRLGEAIEDLDRAIGQRPDSADAWTLRGQAHRALDNASQARADIARALELDPTHPDALLLRANLRALDGDVEGAREDWRRVVTLDADSAAAQTAQYNLARTMPAGN